MTIFWPTTDEERKYYIEYFNLSAKEQFEEAKNHIPVIEENLERDRKYYNVEKKDSCGVGICEPPKTTAGDALPYCGICLNIRPDYYEWYHNRRMLCASWGDVLFDKEKALRNLEEIKELASPK